MRGRRRWLAPVAALGVSLYGAPGAAQIRMQVPEGCGSEEEFTRELDRISVGITLPNAVSLSKAMLQLVSGVAVIDENRRDVADERSAPQLTAAPSM